jgi:regulatory protein
LHVILSIEQIAGKTGRRSGEIGTSCSGRGRIRVTLDDGESFLFSSLKAARLGFAEGKELSEDTYTQIMQSLQSACMQRCGTLLGARDYSECRLREKLIEAGFPDSIVEEAVGKLQKAGYLDDRRFARSYIRSHIQDRSRLRIKRDLADRGIPLADIENAFAEVGEEEDLEEAQREQVVRLLRKRGFDPDRATYEEKQKTMAFLHRKGYSTDLIRRITDGGYRTD